MRLRPGRLAAAFLLPALLLLGACTVPPSRDASPEAVARAAYVHQGPPMLSLFTVLSNANDSGAHTALLINGSQRVLFDPAGTWYHPSLPEMGDVHYGITDSVVDFYIDYHARTTFRVVRQDIVVTPAQAEAALAAARRNGAVAQALCASSTSAILAQVPGIDLGSTLFPKALMGRFGRLPGVTERIYRDDDPDDNGYVIANQARTAQLVSETRTAPSQ